ncbi:hypothetical protein AZL_a01670 (plasmid) [Azospirillum sp. B510]|uniref:hypothetical protein n=1 Tax=Azospirillum sp. (strain B510) TaxID=137722 RepID=UPI0001C4B933|nr:hypothetical protein [Azospirillum sp. B510]BAI73698.1 hypothetical protein AZL_a01670 [Azospirillum sp. B510]
MLFGSEHPVRRFVPLLVAVVVIPWIATLVAALAGAANLADRGTATRTDIVGQALVQDLEKALGLGLPLDRLAGMDDYLEELSDIVPEIELVLIADADGKTLFQKATTGRPDLSARLSPAETDWSAFHLSVQRYPLRTGATPSGEVILGRKALAQPANTRRILIDFAVALTIALTGGALLLRMLVHTQLVVPLGYADGLDGVMARRVYDRIAPPVDQTLIGGLLTEMNRLVIGVNDRFARAHAYLTEVRDLSYNPDAASEVKPLIARIERLGRFTPDRLAALPPVAGSPLPHVVVFFAAVALSILAGVAAQRLPLDTALAATALGVALAVLLARVVGRYGLAVTLAALVAWGVTILVDPGRDLVLAAAVLGGIGAGLPVQTVRPILDTLGTDLAASATGGLVAGAGISILCTASIGTGPVMGIGALSAALGLLVALRVERVASARRALLLPQIFTIDRWWSDWRPAPKGWALWLVTGLALAYAAVPQVAGAPGVRQGAEFIWFHGGAAWLAAIAVVALLPRPATAVLLSLSATALAAGALALGSAAAGPGTALAVAAALGAGHAALAASGEDGGLVAPRGAMALLVGMGLPLLLGGSAGVAAAGLVVTVAVLPPVVLALRRVLLDRRTVPAATVEGSAAG